MLEINACMFTYMFVCTYTLVRLFVCMYVTCVYMYVPISVCIYTYMCIHMGAHFRRQLGDVVKNLQGSQKTSH